MYVDLGQNAVFSHKDIIGIFDLDTATVSGKTRDFLSQAENKGQVTTVSPYDLPSSFTVCATDKSSQNVYISPASTGTIAKRGFASE